MFSTYCDSNFIQYSEKLIHVLQTSAYLFGNTYISHKWITLLIHFLFQTSKLFVFSQTHHIVHSIAQCQFNIITCISNMVDTNLCISTTYET